MKANGFKQQKLSSGDVNSPGSGVRRTTSSRSRDVSKIFDSEIAESSELDYRIESFEDTHEGYIDDIMFGATDQQDLDDIDSSIAELSGSLVSSSPAKQKTAEKKVISTSSATKSQNRKNNMKNKIIVSESKIRAMMSPLNDMASKSLPAESTNIFPSSLSDDFVFDDGHWMLIDDLSHDTEPDTKPAVPVKPLSKAAKKNKAAAVTNTMTSDTTVPMADTATANAPTSLPVPDKKEIISSNTGDDTSKNDKPKVKKTKKPSTKAAKSKDNTPVKAAAELKSPDLQDCTPSSTLPVLPDTDLNPDDWLVDFDLHNDFELHHLLPEDWIVTHSSAFPELRTRGPPPRHSDEHLVRSAEQ